MTDPTTFPLHDYLCRQHLGTVNDGFTSYWRSRSEGLQKVLFDCKLIECTNLVGRIDEAHDLGLSQFDTLTKPPAARLWLEFKAKLGRRALVLTKRPDDWYDCNILMHDSAVYAGRVSDNGDYEMDADVFTLPLRLTLTIDGQLIKEWREVNMSLAHHFIVLMNMDAARV